MTRRSFKITNAQMKYESWEEKEKLAAERAKRAGKQTTLEEVT